MLEGRNMLPLFDIENVKRRISEWKVIDCLAIYREH